MKHLIHSLMIIATIAFSATVAYSSELPSNLEEALELDYGGWSTSQVKLVLEEDITQLSELTNQEKTDVLIGEMRPYWKTFDIYCNSIKYEVVCTISAMETGHFKSSLWKSNNNAGGILCDGNEYMYYKSPAYGIYELCNLLQNQYITSDGRYYNGKGMTILDIAENYNPTAEWLILYVNVRLSQLNRLEEL